jgi:sigma-B regulation protein RsbU (phosphoserine phosphatase)
MNEPEQLATPTSKHSGVGNEELSRRNKDQLYLALSSLRMGSWDWSVLDQSMHWDERMHTLFGLAPSTFGGRYEQFLEMIHAENRPQVAREFVQALERRAEYDGEFRVVWPTDGSVHTLRARSKVVCDNQGKPVLVTGVSWDVSDRSQMENALARERFLLKTLMDTLPDHIYFKDRESRFIAVNRATAALFGFEDSADVLGKTDADLFAREHAQAALRDEREILRTGQPLVNMEEKETWPDGHETWVSTSKLPLRDPDGHIIGTFGLSRDITEKKRAEEKLAVLATELREKNEALEKDLEMARELQQAMLPHRYPHFPHHASKEEIAVRFYHFYQPSMSVSGDFFEVLKLSDTSAGIFICDVMGHGVRAALVASTVSALVGQLRDYLGDPGEFLCRLNRALRSTLEYYSEVPLFASAFYLLANLEKGELHYANAGHPNPLRIHRERDRTDTYPLNGSKHGPALGLFDDAVYPKSHCELSPHDTLLLFTDGLYEVEGPGGDIYDYRRLLEAVSRRRELPASQLCHEVIEEVQRFSAGRHFSDDVCLVAMEVGPISI